MPDLAAWTPRVLSPDQRARKAVLEGNIDRALVHVEDARDDLLELHRLGYWQADAPTFKDYVWKRWPQKCERTVWRLVAKIELLEDLHSEEGSDDTVSHGSFEPSDRCTAAMNRLPPSRRKEAWDIVSSRARAEGKEPTPAMVEAVVKEWEAAEAAAPSTEEVEQSEEETAVEEGIADDKEAWKDWFKAAKTMRDCVPRFRDPGKKAAAREYVEAMPEQLRRRRK